MAVALVGGGLAIGLLALGGELLGVLVLLAAKGLAYAVSLGAGFRGGPIFPAVFIGVALASLGVTVVGMSPTLAIAVGAAAGMAAQTRLLISPLLFAALLVGPSGADAMPAAVLAAVSAWILVGRIDPPRPASDTEGP